MDDNTFKLGNSINGHTLGVGQRWHREDGWTQEMLPFPKRPALYNEIEIEGGFMESLIYEKDLINGWVPATWPGEAGDGVSSETYHHRTTRPLPTVADSQKSCALRIVQPSLKPETWSEERKAHGKGKQIQWRWMDKDVLTDEELQDNKWRDCINSPTWDHVKEYRVKPGDTPTDPMAREKAAAAMGLRIEVTIKEALKPFAKDDT